MKFEGFEPVPWNSPENRSNTAGTCRTFSAAKYSSDCGIGVRRSNSPVISIVGVVTLPTYISDECANHWSGLSQKRASKKLSVNHRKSVSPLTLSPFIHRHGYP